MRTGLLLLLLACRWDPDDRDHDWHIAVDAGGDDCDDEDPEVNPEAAEVCGNGVDDDCDGDAVPCGIGGEMHGAGVLLDGEAYGTEAGAAIADAGDLAGDGRADLAIGAPAAGEVWLVSGALLAEGGAFEDVATALAGERSGDRFGATLAGGGDIDGDGRAGLLVGAPGADGGAGTAYLLEAPHAAVGQIAFAGAPAGAGLGTAVAFVNRPIADAVLIGAPDAGAGGAWLFEAPAAGRHDLADADAAIVGDLSGDGVGIAVAGVDLDGDGRDEVAVGSRTSAVAAIYADPTGQRTLADADGWFTPGTTSADVGLAACDLDGDGREDLVVGAVGVWLVAGPWDGQRGPLQALLLADATTARVACGGDTDGDGHEEVLLAAYGAAHVAIPDPAQPPVFSWLTRDLPQGGLAFGRDLDDDGWDEAFVGFSDGAGTVLVFGGGPGF